MSPDGTNRRSIIRSLGVIGAAGLAGCAGVATPGSSPATTAPTRTNTGPGRCGSGYERVDIGQPSVTDRLDGVVLSSSADPVQPGEEISFGITNESDEERETGNRSTYDLQRHTDSGWRSIFWIPPDDLGVYHSDLVVHLPGEGFTWEFTLTPEDISHEIQNGSGRREVCSQLQAGSYRFVFFGKRSDDWDTALGTQFDVVDG